MDDILNAVVDEVALDGRNALPDFLDEEYQDHLWKYIVKMKQLKFTKRGKSTTPSVAASNAKGKGKAKKAAQTEDEDGEEPAGPTLDGFAEKTRREAVEAYGESLRIVATPEQQRYAIMGRNDPSVRLSAQLYSVLATVAKFRSAGVSQSDLAKKLNLDPRSTFHFIKHLQDLIIKVPVVSRGSSTNLCLHYRFAEGNPAFREYQKRCSTLTGGDVSGVSSEVAENADVFRYMEVDEEGATIERQGGVSYHSDLVKQAITQLLAEAKDHLMVVQDLMDELKIRTKGSNTFERKWFNRLIDAMVKAGYIERVMVPRRKDGQELRGFERCVQLRRQYVAAETISGGASSGTPRISKPKNGLYASRKEQDTDKDKDYILGEGGVLAELPLEWQVYRLIVYAGDKGVISATIQRSLNHIGNRMLSKILTRLTKPDNAPPDALGAHRIGEFVGRERRYRYFSKDAYNRMVKLQAESLNIEIPTQLSLTAAAEPEFANEEEELAAEVRELQTSEEPRLPSPDADVAMGESQELPSRTPSKSPKRSARPQRKSKSNVSYAVDLELDEALADAGPSSQATAPPAEVIDIDADVDTVCKKCKRGDPDSGIVILCDHCNAGMHLHCIRPPLKEVPEGDWFCCRTCKKKGKVDMPEPPPMEEVPAPSIELVPSSPARPRTARIDEDDSDDGDFVPERESDHDDEPMAEGEEPNSLPTPARRSKTPKQTPKPQKQLPTPIVASSSPVRTSEKPSTHRNAIMPSITAALRRNVLNKLLEEMKILEVGHHLISRYQDVVKAMGNSVLSGNHTIDKRTLLRTGKIMAEAGEMAIHHVRVPQMSGGWQTKTIFLHPSRTIEDKDVKDYIDMMGDRTLLMSGKTKQFKVEVRADLQVERVADKRRREREMMSPGWGDEHGAQEETPVGDGGSEAPAGEGETGAQEVMAQTTAKKPKRKLPPRQDAHGEEFWLATAQQYGYISAKMQRAKLFHEWLLLRLLRTETTMEQTPASQGGGPYRNGGVIQTAVIFRELPFELYLKCIGVTVPSPAITEFLKQSDYGKVKVGELPDAVNKATARGPKPKFRRGIKQMVEILGALQIVTALDQVKEGGPSSELGDARARERVLTQESLAWAYKLNWRVPLHDYARDNAPFIRNFNIYSHDTWREYWYQLEFVCARQDLEGWEAIAADPKSAQHDDIHIMSRTGGSDPLSHITLVRNWRITSQFTPYQRTSLDSHIDRKTGQTPLANDILCRDIAEQLKLTVEKVKNYYRRFDDEYQRKMALKPKQTRKRKRGYFGPGAEAPRTRPMSLRGQRMASLSMAYLAALGKVEPPDEESGAGPSSAPSAYAPDSAQAMDLRSFAFAPPPAGYLGDTSVIERIRAAGRRVKKALQMRGQGRLSYRNNTHRAVHVSRYLSAVASGVEEHNNEQLPVIGDEERFQDQYQAAAKRARVLWNQEEDEVLIHAYAIIFNAFPKGERFMWLPVGKLFEAKMGSKRPSELARRRFLQLSKSVRMQDRIKVLEAQWPAVKQKGLAEGAFTIPKHVGPADWDMHTLVNYFREYMNNFYSASTESSAPLYHLPKRPAEIYEKYNVAVVAKNFAVPVSVDIEGELDARATGVQRMAALYARPLTANVYETEQMDFPPLHEEQKRELNLLKALIKMVLVTPEDDWDPTHAFSLIHAYPSEQIAEALQGLRKGQTVVKMKKLTDRGLPGRGFQVSDRFLATLAGTLPTGLLPQAIAFRQQLMKDLRAGEVPFSPFINSGGMFALFEALAANEISVVAPDDEPYEGEDSDEGYTHMVVQAKLSLRQKLIQAERADKGKRRLEEVRAEDLPGKRVRTGNSIDLTGDESVPIDLESGAINIQTPEDVLDSAPVDKREDRVWLKKIYQMITDAGVDGYGQRALKFALQPFGITGDVLDRYLHLLTTKLVLQPDNIPLVLKEGFNDIVYVSCTFHKEWTIAVTERLGPEPPMDPMAPFVLRQVKVTRTPARMWIDMYGKRIDSVVRGCMEAVLGSIMQKPGCYESKLYRRFSPVLTRVELHEILQMLVDKGAARRRILAKPAVEDNPFMSCFTADGSDGYKQADGDDINDEVTCYWAQPNWFMQTTSI
ncbi:hypothetical protein HDV00_012314 [Rhizophlyctis rosea]|nr:hypothetical protein HDV00_012314 [Rhizophlyctis rosea]